MHDVGFRKTSVGANGARIDAREQSVRRGGDFVDVERLGVRVCSKNSVDGFHEMSGKVRAAISHQYHAECAAAIGRRPETAAGRFPRGAGARSLGQINFTGPGVCLRTPAGSRPPRVRS